MWAMKLSLMSIILLKLELEALIIITEQMTEIKNSNYDKKKLGLICTITSALFYLFILKLSNSE